ncbi:MAG: dihydroorotate dehydrogenase [Clostridiaceae bacterium]|nr:dihydroorotate dehydrogenase [Clostridiaceae bacterium]
MADLNVKLNNLTLKNPVMPASGTFGFGHEFADLYDLDLLGAIATKGTTREPRFGNPLPRIAECGSGMLNAVGLQNPGAAAVAETELPALRRVYAGPIIANVCGFSAAEYAEVARLLADRMEVAALEVNISCPNVHCGGMSFGTDPKAAAEVTKAVRRVTKKPVFMKLTPNVTDITEIARACADAGADGLTLINTLLGMRLDLRTRRPVLANVTGGLSGEAVFPVALRAVWQVYEAVHLPIIGVGGVSCAAQVIEMMLAGATAVQVGAANLRDPWACRRIIEGLPAQTEKYGIHCLQDIIGGAHA